MSTNTAKGVISEWLTSGPSREELFDCLKYSPISSIHPGHCVREFWLETKYEDGAKSGSRLNVEIEGLHRGDNTSATSWFFWGRLRLQGSGRTWKPIQKCDKGAFVFGTWNTNQRRGTVVFGKKSFFESSLPEI